MRNIFGFVGLAIIGLFLGVTALKNDFVAKIGGNNQMAAVSEAVQKETDETKDTKDTEEEECDTENTKTDETKETEKTDETKETEKTDETKETEEEGCDTSTEEDGQALGEILLSFYVDIDDDAERLDHKKQVVTSLDIPAKGNTEEDYDTAMKAFLQDKSILSKIPDEYVLKIETAQIKYEKTDDTKTAEEVEQVDERQTRKRSTSMSSGSYIKKSNDVKKNTSTTDKDSSKATLASSQKSSGSESEVIKVRQNYLQEVKALTEKLEIIGNNDTGYVEDDVKYIKTEIQDIVAKVVVLSDVVHSSRGSSSTETERQSVVTNTTGDSSTSASSSNSGGGSFSSNNADEPLIKQRIVIRGNRGESVGELQSFLNTRGAGLSVDNIFGPLTEGAVKTFQEKYGLEVDGIVGLKTLTLLEVLL